MDISLQRCIFIFLRQANAFIQYLVSYSDLHLPCEGFSLPFSPLFFLLWICIPACPPATHGAVDWCCWVVLTGPYWFVYGLCLLPRWQTEPSTGFWFIDLAERACFSFSKQKSGLISPCGRGVSSCSWWQWRWCPSLRAGPAPAPGWHSRLCRCLCSIRPLLSCLAAGGSICCRPSLHVYCLLFKWKCNFKCLKIVLLDCNSVWKQRVRVAYGRVSCTRCCWREQVNPRHWAQGEGPGHFLPFIWPW